MRQITALYRLCRVDFDDIYEELIRWLDEQSDTAAVPSSIAVNGHEDEDGSGKPRNAMIIRFAGSLLKRTLSESFVGIPLTEGADGSEQQWWSSTTSKRNAAALYKVRMLARSLSLQLAKHKHKSAASELLTAFVNNATNSSSSSSGNKEINSANAVVTGNWGCGSRHLGDPQLKFLIQWLAGSVAGVSQIVYYTRRDPQLLKVSFISLSTLLLFRAFPLYMFSSSSWTRSAEF